MNVQVPLWDKAFTTLEEAFSATTLTYDLVFTASKPVPLQQLKKPPTLSSSFTLSPFSSLAFTGSELSRFVAYPCPEDLEQMEHYDSLPPEGDNKQWDYIQQFWGPTAQHPVLG